MVKQYPKDSAEKLNDYFSVSEFKCPCSSCDSVHIDSELVDKLTAMRVGLGGPLRVNSGYRCQNYQDELRLRGYETSVGISQHQLGRAADIMDSKEILTGVQLERDAREAGFMAVGVGGTWCHVDLRSDKIRRWEYKR